MSAQINSSTNSANNCQANMRGFTLIEISLAMIFVAFIITILAATTVSIVRSYNKGIWLSQINTAGQQLTSDIGDKVRYSSPAKVDVDNRRLCVGGVSYIWNTQLNIDRKELGNNTYRDTTEPIRLIRINDRDGSYCTDTSLRPNRNDANVRVLLGRGAIIQKFAVSQGTGANSTIPLLNMNIIISTEGANRPAPIYTDRSGVDHIDLDLRNPETRWMCGDWMDNNGNGILDASDNFKPQRNQFCSFTEYNITLYERSREL